MSNEIFYFERCARKLRYYNTLILLEISRGTRWWCLKCVIVYLARDIPPFVMYCVYGESGSSLLIESTDYDTYSQVFRLLEGIASMTCGSKVMWVVAEVLFQHMGLSNCDRVSVVMYIDQHQFILHLHRHL